ncbi:hypothetical protein [Arthrobacter sp. UYCu712]
MGTDRTDAPRISALLDLAVDALATGTERLQQLLARCLPLWSFARG